MKKSTISIRVDQKLKAACRKMAELEHRSITNLIEIMIKEHADKSGIKIK